MEGVNKIVFMTIFVPDYKVWFYRALDQRFCGKFYAIHGPEREGTRPRDYGPLGIQNDIILRTKFFVFKGIDISWIPCVSWVLRNRPAVMIVQDGVRIISNYFVHLLGKIVGTKIIYYTHGHNHQAQLTRGRRVRSISETIRRFLLNRSDALIVYTQANRAYLKQNGVFTKTFVANNTLDTPTIRNWHSTIEKETIHRLRQSLGIYENQKVIMFLGRLVPEKQVNVFIDVIRELSVLSNAEYVGLVIGDGPSMSELKSYSNGLPIEYVGNRNGIELAQYLACGDCVFLPSHVGLAVIEAFCASKPLITCKNRFHSPEIEYVKHEVNGLLIESSDPAKIAIEISQLLHNETRLARMVGEARKTAEATHPDISITAFEDAVKYVTGFVRG